VRNVPNGKAASGTSPAPPPTEELLRELALAGMRIEQLERQVEQLKHDFDAVIHPRAPVPANAWLLEHSDEPPFGADAIKRDWAVHELIAGERVRGTVRRLPRPGTKIGNYLLLDTDDGVIAIPATAKRGHTVLERLLTEEEIAVGDRIAVSFHGKRRTRDGQREYRHYELERL
jgi:hypothetical protein